MILKIIGNTYAPTIWTSHKVENQFPILQRCLMGCQRGASTNSALKAQETMITGSPSQLIYNPWTSHQQVQNNGMIHATQ